jgi:large subunit ribosomal protein L10
MEAHVADWKKEEVKELTNLFTKNRVVGIIEVGGIPAPQMQQMRKNLQGSATVRSAKNNLILRALDEAEKSTKGVSGLKDHVKGQSAIIATEMNPFKLFSKIKESRTMAPAKGGEKAAHNIEVKSGETPFKPGPIVGELQKAGIPAAIIEGKVVVKTDKVVVPQGERIPADVAQMLTRLEIFPIEIGMTLNGVFEDGEIFSPDVLDINIDEFFGRIRQASINVLNLAITAGWTTKQTIQPLLMKAHNDAFTIALEMGIINKETVKYLISKANNQMLALKNKTT